MVGWPNLFPVKDNGKDGLNTSVSGPSLQHMLKLSMMDMVGTYDDAMDAFVSAESERRDDYQNWHCFDYDHVYASKSFFDANKNSCLEEDGHRLKCCSFSLLSSSSSPP
jgi:beta-fructofuranosidase